VETGQLLVQLVNDELEMEFHDLQLASRQAQAKHHLLLQQNEVAAAQVEAQKQAALEKRLAEKRLQREALQIRAPRSGAIMARELKSMVGTFFHEGDEVLAIGDGGRMEILASVAEPDAQHYAARCGQLVRAHLRSRPPELGRLQRCTPTASTDPDPPALGAHLGGPLAVVGRHGAASDEPIYCYANPRFSATVALSGGHGSLVRSGERGIVAIRTSDQSVARVLYDRAANWVRRKFDASQSAGS
jgi:multidrug resistance efflux pump